MRHLPLLALCLLSLPAPAAARPAYRRALADLLNLPASSPLNDCRTCHLAPKAGAAEDDRPHNAFGIRLKAVRSALKKADRPTDIAARVLHLAGEDSDKDGVANLHELLAGTSPGDAADTPGAAAVAAAKQKQAAFLEGLKGYRWRPFDHVSRPAVPAVRDPGWGRNPIDAFVAAARDRRSLSPRPEAPKEALLRRVTIDLTGLPPTAEELHQFLSDKSPDAYERLVERLLASPRHGERWGRHWMDVWRYSDWAGWGQQVRDSQPHIWHWRDWIIESLNAGKGYDRMVQEMLAADELAPLDTDALRATGYLVRNYKMLSREKWMQDTVDHTGQAFLGLTIGCARCHDHMYDAVTMKEYYQFRAIFTPHHVRTDRLPGWPDVAKNGLPRAYDANLGAPTYLFHRGDDRTPDKVPLAPGVPEALGGDYTPEAVSLPREAHDPNRRAFVVRQDVEASAALVRLHTAQSAPWRADLAHRVYFSPSPLAQLTRVAAVALASRSHAQADVTARRHMALLAVVAAESLGPPGPKPSAAWTQAAQRAVLAQRRLAVAEARQQFLTPAKPPAPRPGLLARLAKAEADLNAPLTTAFTPRNVPAYPTTSTGRRLALARWITHRDNPLAARVAVNHVWARHLGRALVPNTFDFGKNGEPPTHPALVDWLAVELMENNWDLKHLHRLIVTSSTYRQASTPDRANLARDPDNIYLWRFAPRRVEAEVVRDALFFVAGQLNDRHGGADIPHKQGLDVPRRSVYFQHAAEKQMEMMQIFDGASVTECYQRKQAIMPQQSLALINNEMALRQARQAARELDERHAGPEKFITAAFERLLTRRPTADELAACAEFLGERPGLRGRENLIHVLLNHHEFVTLR